MSKNARAFADAMALALSQCKTDREFIPLARYLLAQLDAKKAKRKAARPKGNAAGEAAQVAVRG